MAVIHVRTDELTDKALAELTAEGATPSDVIRDALKLAARQRRRERMREQSLALSRNPEYLAEIKQIQEDIEPYRAW